MFQDSRQIPNGTTISTDVAVIGGGAAGITIAREFENTPHKVVLLESGGLDYDPQTQSLYDGKCVGLEYSLLNSRQRSFGGSTNLWWGNCRPLDAIDFEKRPWIPYSGWPFDKSHLDPYYRRAVQVSQLGAYENFEWGRVKEKAGYPALKFASGNLKTHIYQQSKRISFRDTYKGEIKQAPNVETYLYANAANIAASANAQSVEKLDVKTLAGNAFEVKARYYVLAASGIENARLLLNSNGVQKNGLGNQNGLVGRFFMEHPVLEGLLVPSPGARYDLYNYDLRKAVGGVNVWSMLAPSENFLRQELLTNAGVTVMGGVSQTVQSLDEIKRSLRGEGGENLGEHIKNLLFDLDGIAAYLYEKKILNKERHEMRQDLYVLAGLFEQMPDPENKVVLSDERDALGMRRSELHLRLTDADKKNVLKIFDLFQREFGAEGYGRVRIPFAEDQEWPVKFWDHHMGTTRMHDDPKQGVVDPDCRIHGVKNLYIAGSSVFPTAGYSSPTLTLVALALRLSDHLKGRMS